MGKKISIHQYFVTEADPFSQKRKVNGKSVGVLLSGVLLVSVVVILIWGGEKERKGAQVSAGTEALAIDRAKGAGPSQAATAGTAGSPAIGESGSFYSDYGAQSTSSRIGQAPNRQYTASQLVKAGEGLGGSSGDKLPVGTLISLKLLNRVVSSDQAAPVIALVTEDVLWKDSLVIPEGSKAIGQASLDDVSKRLQVRFNLLVFPEGQERSVSGIGLLSDGSSGIPGDYVSGKTKKQTGRFVGTLVGGIADGMKDRKAGGQLGIAFEPGSLKNGVLNGLTQSAFDQAKLYTDDLEKVRPFLDVSPGVPFLLYLEREF